MMKKRKYNYVICLMLSCFLLFSCDAAKGIPSQKNRKKATSSENKIDRKDNEFSNEQWEKGYDLPISEKEKK